MTKIMPFLQNLLYCLTGTHPNGGSLFFLYFDVLLVFVFAENSVQTEC